MAWFAERLTIQRRLALGYGLMVLDITIIGVVSIVWLKYGLDPVPGIIIVAFFMVWGASWAAFLAWRLGYSLMLRLKAAVGGLGSAVAKLQSVASQVAAGSVQILASANETVATVEEVKQTAVLTLEKATQTAQGAEDSAQSLGVGRQLVEETATGIEQMRGDTEVVSETIERLGEQTQTAGEVVALVNDLAEQSNLLSVNASIEAAKAGDYGKGFTVVAQEVKSLAEQSKQAVSQVRTILSEIQKGGESAMKAAQHSRQTIEIGKQRSLEAVGYMEQVAKQASSDVEASMQVSASSQQQLIGLEQISHAIDSINEASEQSAAGTRLVEQEVKHLQVLSLELSRLIVSSVEA